METDHLGANEVFASSQFGKSDRDLTLVGNELVNAPLAVGKTVLVELGPDSTLTVGVGRGNVNHDGTLVRRSDGLVRVTRAGGWVLCDC